MYSLYLTQTLVDCNKAELTLYDCLETVLLTVHTLAHQQPDDL